MGGSRQASSHSAPGGRPNGRGLCWSCEGYGPGAERKSTGSDMTCCGCWRETLFRPVLGRVARFEGFESARGRHTWLFTITRQRRVSYGRPLRRDSLLPSPFDGCGRVRQESEATLPQGPACGRNETSSRALRRWRPAVPRTGREFRQLPTAGRDWRLGRRSLHSFESSRRRPSASRGL